MEAVKNVKGRTHECVKEQIYGGSRRWGRMVGVSRLQRGDFLPLIYWWECHKAPWHTHTHVRAHIVPTFLSTPTGMSSSPLEMWKRWGEKKERTGKDGGIEEGEWIGCNDEKEGVEKVIALETNEGFPSEIKEREKMALTSNALPSPLLHQWMSSSIIMHSFILLLLCQCMNSWYTERRFLSLHSPSVSLSPSLFLCFSSFIYLNVNYICVGCRHCGVLMYSVLVFLVSVCEWELITKCSFRCFFSLLIKIKDKRSHSAPPPHAISVSLFAFFLTVVYLRIEMQSLCWLTCCLACLSCQYGRQQRVYQRSGVSWPEVSADCTACCWHQSGL